MKKIIAVVISVLLIFYFLNHFFTKSMIVGTYVSNDNAGIDGPNKGDTLILLENNTFRSQTWGKGTYKLEGSSITINYNYELGKASYQMGVRRNSSLQPKLVFDFDLESCFEKVD